MASSGIKQTEYPFLNYVSIIALFALFIFTYFGGLYIFIGNPIFSFLASAFLCICYFFTIKQLEKNKEEFERSKYKHPRMIYFVFFGLLSVISFIVLAHVVNIEFNCKKEIQTEVEQKLQIAKKYVFEYEKRANKDKVTYKSNLDRLMSNIVAYKTILTRQPYSIPLTTLVDCQTNTYNINGVIKKKSEAIDEKTKENILFFNDQISKIATQYEANFQNWDRGKIPTIYNKLNAFVSDAQSKVNDKVKELPYSNKEINLAFDNSSLPLNKPFELNKKYPPNYMIVFLVILLINIGLLLPYKFIKVRKTNTQLSNEEDPLEKENVRIL